MDHAPILGRLLCQEGAGPVAGPQTPAQVDRNGLISNSIGNRCSSACLTHENSRFSSLPLTSGLRREYPFERFYLRCGSVTNI